MPPISTPDRYAVGFHTFDGQQHKAIYRRDLIKEGNRALMIRGMAKDRSALADPSHPHDVIYLDGAARGPYYDKKRGIFSLDHHEECIRAITDSTCVQGMNLARTRIITALGNTIVGNDPDSDTVWGTWALLNADLMAHDDRVFRRVQRVMIVEGNIDSYGFGFEELTGLAHETVVECRQRINWLMQEERELKQRGRWGTVDFVDYTESTLRKIDSFALYSDTLEAPVHMAVHEQLPLKNGQTLHFVQAPDSGIYEVEYTILSHLGLRDCACIIFTDGKGKWTIKLTGFVNDMALGQVAQSLNGAETQKKQDLKITDEGMLKAKWGGGDSIMGAPRYPNGSSTFLSKEQIVESVLRALDGQVAE